MKLDGTLASLHERWFGFRAGEDTATNTVYAGYGHPGVQGGHDPEAHVPQCW
jgi:polar amino acid transport system substrate-binding protein